MESKYTKVVAAVCLAVAASFLVAEAASLPDGLGASGHILRLYDLDSSHGVERIGGMYVQKRNLPPFTDIDLNSVFDSNFKTTIVVDTDMEDATIKIRSRDPVFETGEVAVQVEGGSLRVFSQTPLAHEVDFLIEMPVLKKITVVGTNTVSVTGIHGKRLECLFMGRGLIRLKGSVENLFVDALGHVRLQAVDLKADTIFISGSDFSRAVVFPQLELQAVAKKSSEIYFTHIPEKNNHAAYDAGKIRHVRVITEDLLAEKQPGGVDEEGTANMPYDSPGW